MIVWCGAALIRCQSDPVGRLSGDSDGRTKPMACVTPRLRACVAQYRIRAAERNMPSTCVQSFTVVAGSRCNALRHASSRLRITGRTTARNRLHASATKTTSCSRAWMPSTMHSSSSSPRSSRRTGMVGIVAVAMVRS